MFGRLSTGERQLILLNPIDGLATLGTVREVFAVSDNLFEDNFSSLEDGRGDAFRHSYWNWLISECCCVDWAAAYATAHEVRLDQTPSFYKIIMDMNNNKVGRDVFAANENASRAQAQQALLEHNLEFIDYTIATLNYDFDRLLYVAPQQTITIYDDGPAFDDIYEIGTSNEDWGLTPSCGAKTITLSRVSSGEHALNIKCLVDGTEYGCGFQFSFIGAARLPNGDQASSGQILLEESQVHSETIIFPTMDVEKEIR